MTGAEHEHEHEHDERCAGRTDEQAFAAFLADLRERQREPAPDPEQLGPYRAAMDDALRQLADDVGVPSYLLDYGAILARAVELNDRYAGRWHVWFVALAGEVEWLARPFDAEPVGEPELSAWSADELIEQIERRLPLWVRGIMSARAAPAADTEKPDSAPPHGGRRAVRRSGVPSGTGAGSPPRPMPTRRQ